MMRAISQEDFIATAPDLLTHLGDDIVVIHQGERTVAALVSGKELEQLRQGRSQRALAAMNRISDAIQASGVSEEELRELEQALDRKA